jgi:hypothetical protein
MHALSLPLVLCGWLVTQQPVFPDLSFHAGALTGWEGDGFAVSRTAGKEPQEYWASSQDQAGKGHKALLHRVFVIPTGAEVIRFKAYASRAKGLDPDGPLEVLLMAAGKRIIPKRVRTANGWLPVSRLLSSEDGQPREYLWRVGDYVGQYVRIVLEDEDDRPGCYVSCSGFQILAGDEFEGRDFSQFMVRLAEQHHLSPMVRYDSRHFIALSDAEENFTELRLGNCELLYTLFWDHFRRKGITLREPRTKLMVAMFDSQEGFNAYLGRRESPVIIGYYHTLSNRFVVYDYGQNELHQALKGQAEQRARQIDSYLERQRWVETVQRRAHDFRSGANISTVMHEVAHQLSFNCGMLNREGDVPFWLAEGLACYCEATDNGSWQGIGEPNSQRLRTFVTVLANKGQLIGLTDLITRDDWMPGARDTQTTLLAYAQSWALFRMLIEERPNNMKTYLTLIYPRQIRDRRLADFQQAFGADLPSLQRGYAEYIRSMILQQGQLGR